PDSIHPETQQPYIWVNSSLLDIIPEDLPRLPEDIEQRIEKALEPFGYISKPTKESDRIESVSSDMNGGDADFDTLHGKLNAAALKSMSKWVPDLNLFRCRRRSGPHASYEAVATWRPSTTGQAPEVRKLNLKISPLGIVDFGDNRGYSPLDLVMAARACGL